MRWGVRDEATDDHMTTECKYYIMNENKLCMNKLCIIFIIELSVYEGD
jgi:hypothetical protein